MSQRFFHVEWSPPALDDWRLAPDVQAVIGRAVENFPQEGIAVVTGPTEYALFVGPHIVVLLVEGDILHVDRVRRA